MRRRGVLGARGEVRVQTRDLLKVHRCDKCGSSRHRSAASSSRGERSMFAPSLPPDCCSPSLHVPGRQKWSGCDQPAPAKGWTVCQCVNRYSGPARRQQRRAVDGGTGSASLVGNTALPWPVEEGGDELPEIARETGAGPQDGPQLPAGAEPDDLAAPACKHTRTIRTTGHIDAVRGLQKVVLEPAPAASQRRLLRSWLTPSSGHWRASPPSNLSSSEPPRCRLA